jgi:hypothetical protein
MWIEAITVRTARPEQCAVLLEELAVFQQQDGMPRPERFDCYRNLEVENEIAIRLLWEDTPYPPAKTDCGQLVARFLEQHGMVRHTLWKHTGISGAAIHK